MARKGEEEMEFSLPYKMVSRLRGCVYLAAGGDKRPPVFLLFSHTDRFFENPPKKQDAWRFVGKRTRRNTGLETTPCPRTRLAKTRPAGGAGAAPEKTFAEERSALKRSVHRRKEKVRRDKIRLFLQELAGLVPLAAGQKRRLDKLGILRLSSAYLKVHQGFIYEDSVTKSKPRFQCQRNIVDVLEQVIGGFLMVVSREGTLILVSDAISRYLGYVPVDVIGLSVFKYIHPDDKDTFQGQLNCHTAVKCVIFRERKDFSVRMLNMLSQKAILDFVVPVQIKGLTMSVSQQLVPGMIGEQWLFELANLLGKPLWDAE